MKPLIVSVVIAAAFTGLGYVRRETLPPGRVAYLVDGSRDRTLHGKARRRARRAT